jgi:uncharacterized protein YhfF
MWPRVAGLRALELGTPGELRARLNALVLSGVKTATADLLVEYDEEGEELEYVGERLALVDDDGMPLRVVEAVRVDIVPFAAVGWDFAQAEGEGFTSVEHWRQAHRAFWNRLHPELEIDDDTQIVCLHIALVDEPPG